MRVVILDDIQRRTTLAKTARGLRRLRTPAEVRIFRSVFGAPAELKGFDALIANGERTRFEREVLEQLPDLRVIADREPCLLHRSGVGRSARRHNLSRLAQSRQALADQTHPLQH